MNLSQLGRPLAAKTEERFRQAEEDFVNVAESRVNRRGQESHYHYSQRPEAGWVHS